MNNYNVNEKTELIQKIKDELVINLVKSTLLAYMISGLLFVFNLWVPLLFQITYGILFKSTLFLFLILFIYFNILCTYYSYQHFKNRKETLK